MISRKLATGKRKGCFFACSAKKRDRRLYLKGVEIDNYSFRHLLRRGATAHAMNNGVPQPVINEINQWRKKENAKGGKTGFTLAQVYSSVRHIIPTKIKYLQSH